MQHSRAPTGQESASTAQNHDRGVAKVTFLAAPESASLCALCPTVEARSDGARMSARSRRWWTPDSEFRDDVLGRCRFGPPVDVAVLRVMAREINAEDVAPVIPGHDPDAAIGGLASRSTRRRVISGRASRKGVACRFMSANGRIMTPTRAGAVVYLYVSDADALHAEWAHSAVERRLGDPRDTEYGLREFGFVDPDGTLHRVGSRLSGSPPS